MRTRMKLSASLGGVGLLLLPCAASALPLGVESPATTALLARAAAALRGQPAERKVRLLAEPASGNRKVDLVHVLPRSSSAKVTLRVLGKPSCKPLQTAIDEVNRQISGLAGLAEGALVELQLLSDRQAAQDTFLTENAESLALARQGTLELRAAETYAGELASTLETLSDPVTAQLYELELTEAEAELNALRSDPVYLAAWDMEERAQVQEEAIASDHARWTADHEARLAETERALERAQADYDALSSVEVGSAVSAFSVWDPDVQALFRGNGASRPFRFTPATLENLSWTVEDGALPRMVPVTFSVEPAGSAASTSPVRTVPLPGLAPLPPRKALELVDASDFRDAVTELASDDARPPARRRTRVLMSEAPRVRTSLSLGAYCGSLQRTDTVVAARRGTSTRTAVRAARYALRLRPRAQVEQITALGRYEVKVEGPPSKITCTLTPGAPRGPSVRPVLARDGSLTARWRGVEVRCTGEGLARLSDAERERMLRQLARDVATDPEMVAAQAELDGFAVKTQPASAKVRTFEQQGTVFWTAQRLLSTLDVKITDGR